MKREDVQHFTGRKVKILLKNKFVYTAILKSTSDDVIRILDKFSNDVVISLDDIAAITNFRESRG